MPATQAVCPHCESAHAGGEHCEHWICATADDLLKVLMAEHVTTDFDPAKLEQHRGRYEHEIGKWAIERGDAWFTSTPEAGKMRRRLQQSVFAMAKTGFKVV